MNQLDRRKKEKAQRRNLLIDAAEKVIFEKGIENATMDEIAEAAEFSKGTLYYYFNNKNDLYLAINNRGLTILNERFASVLAEDRPGIELVKRLGEEYINFVRDYPNYFHAFLYHENTDLDEEKATTLAKTCEQQGKRAHAYAVRALQIGMQDGSITDQYDPTVLAMQLWGSIRGITQLYYFRSQGQYDSILGDLKIDRDNLVYDFIDLLINGLNNDA